MVQPARLRVSHVAQPRPRRHQSFIGPAWDTPPEIAGVIQVGSDQLCPTANSTGWAQRTTGPDDVPAGARSMRIGWDCPVSTSTQYACADDLVLSIIIDSEPGAGGGAGAYRPLLRVAM